MSGAGVTYRLLQEADVPAAEEVAHRAFVDLAARLGRAPWPRPPAAVAQLRFRHLIATDRSGAVLAERGGEPVGVALALVREGLWGLSLLVVDPDAQSGRVGSELLARALEHGAGARGGVILASEDSRAMRAYARAGFAVHPVLEATGVPRRLESSPAVRRGGVEDRPLCDAVDRAVRGAAHASDLDTALAGGAELLILPVRGYALLGDGAVRMLAALDDDAARELLRAAIATAAENTRFTVDWVSATQDWAMPVLLDAGLELRVGGAVFLRGDVGPFRPYLPSGAYL